MSLLLELRATEALLRRLVVLRNRLDRDQARDDKRQWVQDRRARTRHLIELGGLVQKAGLVELVDDDRATLLGAFLELAGRLREAEYEHQGEKASDLLTRWRRRGLRAFDADASQAETIQSRRTVGGDDDEDGAQAKEEGFRQATQTASAMRGYPDPS